MARLKRLTPWLVLAGILILVLGGGALWIAIVAELQWRRMESRIAELEAERDHEVRARPVLRGAPVPGNAWTEYAAALSGERLPYDDRIDRFLNKGGAGPPLEAMLDWASGDDASLDRFRSATRKAEVRPTSKIILGFLPSVVEMEDEQHDNEWLKGTWTLPRAAAIKARGFLEAGKSDEAVMLLLDVCQFGRDCLDGTSGEAEELAARICDLAFAELRRALSAKSLSAEACGRLERELEILDGGWPASGSILRNHLIAFGKGCESEGTSGTLNYDPPAPKRSLRSWRWGFSNRLRAASTFLRADEWYRVQSRNLPTVKVANPEPWPDRVLVDYLARDFDFAIWDARAKLRVIRVAARFRSTGGILKVDDPFGGPMKTELKAGWLRIWTSAALNESGEIDDGGPERSQGRAFEIER